MAAQWARQTVQKLQARLATHAHDPRELRQCLERLSVLPMTGDILADTGVRKTVRGLRKHQLVGSLAKELAARWKILALLFKGETPRERESWREMYLRLREAREQRLQAVAARIQSNTRKATAKKAAPLMAKTLRDYKHCKSRSYRP
ncbi:elongin-A3-like [Castor canadensis]|uniref:Elongin-A3-like n=1 Tax=Castor canadensis TaxID=51338 RepID=A0AC58LUB9_CASCN